MSVNNAFRSHLMQQFASAARGQARPPLVLLSTTTSSSSSSSKSGNYHSTTQKQQKQPFVSSWQQTTTHSFSSSPPSSSPPTGTTTSGNVGKNTRTKRSNYNHQKRDSSSKSMITSNQIRYLSIPNLDHNTSDDIDIRGEDKKEKLAQQFQSMIMTRRTVSRFQDVTVNHDDDKNNYEWIQSAIERAVSCAITAPNHFRTEPVTCRRFTNQSNTGKDLLDICFQVALQRQGSIQSAQQKRDKWSQIPAFVLVTVENQPPQVLLETNPSPKNSHNYDDHGDVNNTFGPYDTLPFTPPQTELQLEDVSIQKIRIFAKSLNLHSFLK